MVMLVLFNLSAAFYTVDHEILLKRLSDDYGVEGTALKWFTSNMSDRTQCVIIKDSSSKTISLSCGVPQGSKLGPILFNTHISPLSNITRKHNIVDEKYADDEQLILAFKPEHFNSNLTIMEKCINEIRQFLIENKLCNNSSKTEFLLRFYHPGFKPCQEPGLLL